MMDILDDAFGKIDFNKPIAILTYDDKISLEVFRWLPRSP